MGDKFGLVMQADGRPIRKDNEAKLTAKESGKESIKDIVDKTFAQKIEDNLEMITEKIMKERLRRLDSQSGAGQ